MELSQAIINCLPQAHILGLDNQLMASSRDYDLMESQYDSMGELEMERS